MWPLELKALQIKVDLGVMVKFQSVLYVRLVCPVKMFIFINNWFYFVTLKYMCADLKQAES